MKLSRRGLLAGTATLAGTNLLGACSKKDDPAKVASKAASEVAANKSALPTHKALESTLKPDLPGNAAGAQDAYFTFPKESFKSVNGPIGDGNPLKCFMTTYSQPPTAHDKNQYWQMVEEKANIKYQPELVPINDYPTKFATTAAGGDLPDTMQIIDYLNLPKVEELLKAKFEDLTPYLAGDKVLEYPNLAALPSTAWAGATYGGKLYGVPFPSAPFNSGPIIRKDIIDKLGLQYPKTGDEFLEFCKALTDAKAGKYAVGGWNSGGSSIFLPNLVAGLFKLPNNWEVVDGKLRNKMEHPDYLKSIEFTKKLWDAKVIHPDSPGMQYAQSETLYYNGTIVMREDGLTSLMAQGNHPDIEMDTLVPFAYDGGPGVHHVGRGFFSFTAIKKADEKRIKEILRVINYFASPFGSEEYFDLHFGIKGHNYELDKEGSPKATDTGNAEMSINTDFVGAANPVIFSPIRMDEGIKRYHAAQVKLGEIKLEDPTAGLHAPSQAKLGDADQKVNDATLNYILGRGKQEDITAAIDAWRKKGGDKVRDELTAAMQADGRKLA